MSKSNYCVIIMTYLVFKNKKVKKFIENLIKKNSSEGPVAQLVEHLPFKQGVLGPNPSRVTKGILIIKLRVLFI